MTLVGQRDTIVLHYSPGLLLRNLNLLLGRNMLVKFFTSFAHPVLIYRAKVNAPSAKRYGVVMPRFDDTTLSLARPFSPSSNWG